MSNRAFAFMGGTFDPIHYGHLRSALEVQQWLGIDQVYLVPAKSPVHRGDPGCSAQQRLEMVESAVSNVPALTADDREISTDKPSYSVLTAQSLRAELGVECSLSMIMGMDAFLSLPSWYQWRQLLEQCHLIVLKRPGYLVNLCNELAELLDQQGTECKYDLLSNPAGRVLIHEQTPLEISATQIRQLIGQQHSPQYLLPDAVWQYIKQHNLYGFRT